MSVLAAKKVKCLSLGVSGLDAVFSGFELGDFAVLHGNAASLMSFTLSVQAQLALERGGLASPTVFVDGGNMFNPYLIAETARDYGLDSRVALEKIYVSRAFTAYQLSSLILEKLPSVLRKTKAQLLVISDITSLLSDRDMPKTEARELFMKTCSKLTEIASEKQAVVIVTYFSEGQSRQGLFFEAVLFGKCSILLKLKRKGKVLSFILENHPSIKPFSMDFTTKNHVSLDAFMEG